MEWLILLLQRRICPMPDVTAHWARMSYNWAKSTEPDNMNYNWLTAEVGHMVYWNQQIPVHTSCDFQLEGQEYQAGWECLEGRLLPPNSWGMMAAMSSKAYEGLQHHTEKLKALACILWQRRLQQVASTAQRVVNVVFWRACSVNVPCWPYPYGGNLALSLRIIELGGNNCILVFWESLEVSLPKG